VDPEILKVAKIVVLTFMTKWSKWERVWVEQEYVLLIIAGLPNGTGLPNA
jgi:hypothetical protein